MTLMKSEMKVQDRLIVALDVSSLEEAAQLVGELKDHVGMFKVGLELYSCAGTALFDLVKEQGIPIFFDGKFHDIPNTVYGATANIARHGVAMLNVHTTGGSAMMRAAKEACDANSGSNSKPILIGVTVLTSISPDTLSNELAVNLPVKDYVTSLAVLAKESGLDGVVASAQEARTIREACGPDFQIVTPGIRPDWSAKNDDQSRILTPSQALKNGADYLVVGRPITQAKDKREAAIRVLEEMNSALSN